MKITISIITLLLLFFSFSKSSGAVTVTPSASPTQDIEDKYKQIVEENVSSIAAKLQEKVNLMSLLGYAGNITTINSGNLTLDSHGNLIQATVTAKTVYLKDGKTIKDTALAIGDKIIIIGTSVKEGIIQAKRITVIKDEPNPVTTSAVVAKVVSVNIKNKNLTLKINDTDTVFVLSKKSTVKLDELKAEQTILGIIKEYNGVLSISRAKVL